MPSKVGMTLTLPLANTNYRLADLIATVDPNATNRFVQITVAADLGNASPVLEGDALLSAVRFGRTLAPGDSYNEGSGDNTNSVSTLSTFVRSAGVAQKLHFSGRIG